jgi:hypothetical protein
MVTKAAGIPIAAQIGGFLQSAYILSDWVAVLGINCAKA